MKQVVEGAALAIVIAFPLWGALWYFSGGDNASATPQNIPQQSTQAPTAATAQAPQGSGRQAISASITLDDPSALPQTVSAAQIIPFSFTLKNTGESEISIPYKVSVKWRSGESDVIDENAVDLEAGAAKAISEALKFETADAAGEVTIEIPGTGESIRFAMPRT